MRLKGFQPWQPNLIKLFFNILKKINDIIRNVAILDKKNFIENKIETSSEFHALVRATRDEFGNPEIASDGDMTPSSMIKATHYESAWRYRVGNVLRRSLFYINIFEKQLNDPSEEFEKYVQVFKSSEKKITYLAPLEYVSFRQGYSERQSDIDCGYFQIKSFSRDELDATRQRNPSSPISPSERI